VLVTFNGFPKAGLGFLEALAADNTKTFFDANRPTYEAALLEPARAFVEEAGAALRERISPAIRAEPRISGSILRPNRDTRFGTDKTPYKTYFDVWFWEGSRPSRECPGFFFRLTPDLLTLGSGMHRFDPTTLARYRAGVADEQIGVALEAAVRAATVGGKAELAGIGLARVPKGFDADHPRAALLRHTGLFVFVDHRPVPAVIHTRRFTTWCVDRFARMAPVHRWLADNLF